MFYVLFYLSKILNCKLICSLPALQFIVSTLATRKDTTVIAIHPETGQLQFSGVKGKDVFLNEKEAIGHLKAHYQLKNVTYVLIISSAS